MRKPWIREQRIAVALGAAFFVAGVLLFYDAYERRGARTPMILRPFLPT